MVSPFSGDLACFPPDLCLEEVLATLLREQDLLHRTLHLSVGEYPLDNLPDMLREELEQIDVCEEDILHQILVRGCSCPASVRKAVEASSCWVVGDGEEAHQEEAVGQSTQEEAYFPSAPLQGYRHLHTLTRPP